MELKLLPAGVFDMGWDLSLSGEPPTQVTLTQPFYIGVHEVTQAQYEQVMGNHQSRNLGTNHPVDTVSWEDATEFCRKLSELHEEETAGRVYRLPTSTEWEYACRAGTAWEYSYGNDESLLVDYAWYLKNSGETTHPVGQKLPNAWGLFDMHGNVAEWCQDWDGEYPGHQIIDLKGPTEDKFRVIDPKGPNEGERRLTKGGSYVRNALDCIAATKSSNFPSRRHQLLGFRVVFTPPAPDNHDRDQADDQGN